MFRERPNLRLLDERARPEDIDSTAADLSTERKLAFDLEADSFYRYHERVCLIQISSPTVDVVLDPLAHGLPSSFRQLIEDPTRTWVLHGGDFDVLSMRRDFGVVFGQIFDTMISARFLGRSAFGLAALLQSELGIQIEKGEQRSDWGRRPLTPAQIGYACQDTAHLIALAGRLERELADVGRVSWVAEECELLRRRVPTPKQFDPDSWWDLKGVRELSEPGRRVARAAYLWREEAAERANKAPFRILREDAIVEMGRAIGSSADSARSRIDAPALRSVPNPALRDDLRRAIARALEGEAATPPQRANRRGDRPTLDPRSRSRSERLRRFRDHWSRHYLLEPGLVLPRFILDTLAQNPPLDRDGLSAVQGMTRWRLEAMGEALLEVLYGGVSRSSRDIETAVK